MTDSVSYRKILTGPVDASNRFVFTNGSWPLTSREMGSVP